MTIKITGHNLEITPAIRDLTEKKLAKIVTHFPQLTGLHITFTVEKNRQIAEGIASYPHHPIHATAEHADLYAALDLLIVKLHAQLVKLKEKLSNHQS